jgi:hypothetical protein
MHDHDDSTQSHPFKITKPDNINTAFITNDLNHLLKIEVNLIGVDGAADVAILKPVRDFIEEEFHLIGVADHAFDHHS